MIIIIIWNPYRTDDLQNEWSILTLRCSRSCSDVHVLYLYSYIRSAGIRVCVCVCRYIDGICYSPCFHRLMYTSVQNSASTTLISCRKPSLVLFAAIVDTGKWTPETTTRALRFCIFIYFSFFHNSPRTLLRTHMYNVHAHVVILCTVPRPPFVYTILNDKNIMA